MYPRTIRVPEPPLNKDSRTPQTYKTYKDFKDSLSEDEREKFLKFVREKIKEFPKPINDVEGWLASKNKAGVYRWHVYCEMFQAEVGDCSSSTRDWEKHPKHQEWLNLLRTKGMAFCRTNELDYGNGEIVHFGTPEDRPEREAFAAWAQANNRIWGEEL